MIRIILVTYNRISTLKPIINKIETFNWSYSEFIIINNNSTDGSTEYLSTLGNNYKIFNLSENVGHGAALAVGLNYVMNNSNGEEEGYTVFLEDDSIPSVFLLEKLVNIIKTTDFDFISSDGQKIKLGKRIKLLAKGNEVLEADFCLFDGAILKNKVIRKIGVQEENWFMMFDDFEYCYRIKKNGFKIGVIHNDFHEILHFGGGNQHLRSSIWRGYYQTRNHVFFLKKHFNFFNFFDFLILNFKRLIGCFFSDNKYQRFKLRIIGLYHGLINKKGKTLNPLNLKFNKL